MYKLFEVDYNDRSHFVRQFDDLKEAKRIGNKTYKNSNGEYPVFIEDGENVVWNKK